MPDFSWTDGYLIFAALAPLLALDLWSGLRDWLRDRHREGRMGSRAAHLLTRARILS